MCPGRLKGALAGAVDVVATRLLCQDDDVAPHLALLEEVDELGLPLQPRVLPLLGGHSQMTSALREGGGQTKSRRLVLDRLRLRDSDKGVEGV